jgi:hypothetical protein
MVATKMKGIKNNNPKQQHNHPKGNLIFEITNSQHFMKQPNMQLEWNGSPFARSKLAPFHSHDMTRISPFD